MRLSSKLFLYALCCLLQLYLAEMVTDSTPHDYSYPSTLLLSTTDSQDKLFSIHIPFNVSFHEASFDTLYVSADSFISFVPPSEAKANLSSGAISGILIGASRSLALNITVSHTDSNITIYYRGQRSSGSDGIIQWFLTFYNLTYEKFRLEVRLNGLTDPEGRDGYICSAVSCYQSIPITTPGAWTYWDCGVGCFNPIEGTCNYNFNNCSLCPSQQKCKACSMGFEWDGDSNSCISCNINPKSDKCDGLIPNCIAYFSYDTESCSECAVGYLGPKCDVQYAKDNRVSQDGDGGDGDDGNNNNGSSNGSTNSTTSSSSVGLIVGIVFGSIVAALLIGLLIYCCIRSNKAADARASREIEVEVERPRVSNARQYQLAPIAAPSIPASAATSIINPPPVSQEQIRTDQCSICLNQNPEILTGCRHLFHISCLTKWYRKEQRCPNCNDPNHHFFLRCTRCHAYGVQTGLNSIPPAHRQVCRNCQGERQGSRQGGPAEETRGAMV